jgi:hypothetical protein
MNLDHCHGQPQAIHRVFPVYKAGSPAWPNPSLSESEHLVAVIVSCHTPSLLSPAVEPPPFCGGHHPQLVPLFVRKCIKATFVLYKQPTLLPPTYSTSV